MAEPCEHHLNWSIGDAEVLYEDCRVPRENLIGEVGGGFLLAQKRLGPGRIHHCMRRIGMMQRVLDAMCERAVSRYTHGSLLSEKQSIQNYVADSAAQMHAAHRAGPPVRPRPHRRAKRPASMSTSPTRPGFPVPSTTVAPRTRVRCGRFMIASSVAGRGRTTRRP